MDCCDLTGDQPAWAVHEPPSGADDGNAGDHTSARERSRSLDKDYMPPQQQQPGPVSQPPQPGHRPNRPDMSSCTQLQQQPGNYDRDSNTSHSRTQFAPRSGRGYKQSSPHNVSGNSVYQSIPGYTAADSGNWGNMRSQSTRGCSQNSPYNSRGRGGCGSSNGFRARAYNTPDAGSWGSAKSNSAVDDYQSGARGGFRPRGQYHHGSSHSTMHPSDRGMPRYGSTGYSGYSNANSSDRPSYGGRGTNGSASTDGGMHRSGSGGLAFGSGRGFGGSRPGSAWQGSGPPPWVKQGCWLVPRSGSGFEQALRAAAAAAAMTGGSNEGAASVDVHQRQQQQLLQVLDLTADDGAVEAAPAVDDGTTAAPANGTLSSSIPSDSDDWLGQDKVVVILRGLPGAGKSTRAAQIVAKARAAAAGPSAIPAADMKSLAATMALLGAADSATLDDSGPNTSSQTGLQGASVLARNPVQAAVIHSTDSFFVDPATAVYTFNVELLSVNHQRNLDAFCSSLAAGVRTVIVDNTNIQPWQFEKYVTAAWSAGYRVREEVVGQFTQAAAAMYAARNVHGVPYEKLLMMLDQWKQQ